MQRCVLGRWVFLSGTRKDSTEDSTKEQTQSVGAPSTLHSCWRRGGFWTNCSPLWTKLPVIRRAIRALSRSFSDTLIHPNCKSVKRTCTGLSFRLQSGCTMLHYNCTFSNVNSCTLRFILVFLLMLYK